MSTEPTVFVVDDDPKCCDSLKWLIESVGLPVETFESAKVFLDEYDDGRPGCLILDVRMPGMSGIELQEHLRRRNLHIPIIIVTAYGNIPMAVRAMKLGAVSFLEKPYSDDDLLRHVRQALDNDSRHRECCAEHNGILEQLAQLTPREREVMDLVVAGLSSREAADELQISIKTIEAHRGKIMKKLNAKSATDLIRMSLAAQYT